MFFPTAKYFFMTDIAFGYSTPPGYFSNVVQLSMNSIMHLIG